MPIYIVTYEHPDDAGWAVHVMPHVAWLKKCAADGSLLASGPCEGTAVKSAMLLLKAAERPALDALIATDPFAIEGLIANMTVQVWDPIFGAFNQHSSMPQAATG